MCKCNKWNYETEIIICLGNIYYNFFVILIRKGKCQKDVKRLKITNKSISDKINFPYNWKLEESAQFIQARLTCLWFKTDLIIKNIK